MIRKGLYFVYFLVVLSMIFFNIGKAHGQSIERQSFFEDISPKEAYSIIQKYFKTGYLVILDVRTHSEFKAGHIEGAINVDYYSESFEKILNKMDKTKTFLVYCRSGVRSGRATYIMKDLGFKKIYNIIRGILEWIDEGFPIMKNGKVVK